MQIYDGLTANVATTVICPGTSSDIKSDTLRTLKEENRAGTTIQPRLQTAVFCGGL